MTIVSGHAIIFWLFNTYVLYFLHNIHFSVLFSSCWEKFWFIQWKLINLGKKTCHPQGKNRKKEYLGSACLMEIILCVVDSIEVKGNRIWTSIWSLSEDKGSWIFLHTSSCMDIEMLLVFWRQSGCQGMVTNALQCICAFGAHSVFHAGFQQMSWEGKSEETMTRKTPGMMSTPCLVWSKRSATLVLIAATQAPLCGPASCRLSAALRLVILCRFVPSSGLGWKWGRQGGAGKGVWLQPVGCTV